jgi:phage major head subunit gpT-like protein
MASPSGRIVKPDFTDLYDLNIQNQYIQGGKDAVNEFASIYKVVHIKRQDTRYSHVSGFTTWPLKPFGGDVRFDGIYEGYDTTITPKTYASGFMVETETADDDPTGIISGIAGLSRNLAQMGLETREQLAAVIPNAATTLATCNTWQSGGDGKALLANDHPILSGGTFSNIPSSHCNISIAALQAGYTAMAKTQNARGIITAMLPETLVYPVDSKFLVDELLDGDKKPYTADNTPNSIQGILKKKMWTQLTDTNMWLLLASPAASPGAKGHCLVAVIRQDPEFGRDGVFLSGDRQYKGDQRLAFGYYDWRGTYGSTGA